MRRNEPLAGRSAAAYEADAMLAKACNPMVGNPRNNVPEMLNSA
ncbi:hypothetical protein ACPOL_1414 [Acidisarcina polymorpha]|uniref:Uncharacterized protein n=1 Tax=Acidisarcina polymorpha TaxID=2211140 RepID=A0A2Z5FVI1_9BACT|nr:hypothetical protein [Acidisarcina polymorpha]AXC10762.1 hypothetical protein ACPOL_1414 [Acidisarcina polymorpha]